MLKRIVRQEIYKLCSLVFTNNSHENIVKYVNGTREAIKLGNKSKEPVNVPSGSQQIRATGKRFQNLLRIC